MIKKIYKEKIYIDIDKEKNMMKLCEECNTVKDMEKDYYKAGLSYQRLCKPCHNQMRRKYKVSNKPYVPKPTGFDKLNEDMKKSILYDISVKVNYKKIAQKYDIKYSTLCYWKRKGMCVQES